MKERDERVGFTKRWSRWERALALDHRWRYGLYRGVQFAIAYSVAQILFNRLDHRLEPRDLVAIGATVLVVGTLSGATFGRWILLGRLDQDGDRFHRPGPYDPFS